MTRTIGSFKTFLLLGCFVCFRCFFLLVEGSCRACGQDMFAKSLKAICVTSSLKVCVRRWHKIEKKHAHMYIWGFRINWTSLRYLKNTIFIGKHINSVIFKLCNICMEIRTTPQPFAACLKIHLVVSSWFDVTPDLMAFSCRLFIFGHCFCVCMSYSFIFYSISSSRI